MEPYIQRYRQSHTYRCTDTDIQAYAHTNMQTYVTNNGVGSFARIALYFKASGIDQELG